ncbi:hypothetical protein [Oleiharenicola lentus]|uniref:hypothetical protein n=1 Tax=Oleiharenicola lentus TaxID=2508720 RepID=UPI003F662438
MNSLAAPAQTPWHQLQNELRDLAFLLDRKGNPVAADVAMNIAARIQELIAHTASTPALTLEASAHWRN